MVARVIVLAGAPECNDLTWEDHTLTCPILPCFSRFLGEDVHEKNVPCTMSSSPEPKWRLVKEFSDRIEVEAVDRAAPTVSQYLQALPMVDNEPEYADFLEHSFAALEQLDETQFDDLPNRRDRKTPSTTAQSEVSLDTTSTNITDSTTSFNSTSISPSPAQPISCLDIITDLSALPTASLLQSLHPHHPPINLLAGVISVTPPRTVTLRRPRHNLPSSITTTTTTTTQQSDLLDLLLGDDTRAGVRVTAWLPSLTTTTTTASSPSAQPRALLEALRPGDLVLLRRVALSAYRGVVYGQVSVGRRGQRSWGGSRVERLGAVDLVRSRAGFGEKVVRVREWLERFVGSGVGRETGAGKRSRREAEGRGGDGGGGRAAKMGRWEEDWPPDTQVTGVG